MKRRLGWRHVSRETLAEHLGRVDIIAAEAIGDTSIYRCLEAGEESIAVSLGNGQGDGLIIEVSLEIPAALERRRAGSNSPLDE
ncbi:MAG: hypothetical protein L6Q60_03210 [Rhodocyclaceae bacterium]|jgi:hypothetical protein|nr:hypothetical protein [Rhodocyclaceae bacterium]